MAVTEVKKPKCVCNINQARKAFKMRHVFITDSDQYFILDELKRRDTIEYDIDMIVDDKEYQFI